MMRKTNIFLMMAITLALFASVAFGQTNNVSAQKNEPVGVVVDYLPGQSITIVDQQGFQSEFMLDTALKIVPPGRADSLAVGSFVTVIAPASLDKGKQIAVGIVIHPEVPKGWKVPDMSEKSVLTEKVTPTGTLMTETETPAGVETATTTPEVTFTDTPTPPAKTPGGETTLTTNALIEWLRSLFQQVLGNQ